MSANLRCTGTPISWLRLERHHAGELETAERAAIALHLTECAACAACLATLEEDEATPLPALPPLAPEPAVASEPSPATGRAPRFFVLRRIAPPLAALAVAAGVLLFLGRHPGPREIELGPAVTRTKGGDVAFVLVRDDGAVVAEEGGVYREGDRWKALVTCPPEMHAAWDVVVYERGDAAFPLEPMTDFACGNRVPLPGAFRTTGKETMTVCLVWNDGAAALPLERTDLRRSSAESLTRAACKVLSPAP